MSQILKRKILKYYKKDDQEFVNNQKFIKFTRNLIENIKLNPKNVYIFIEKMYKVLKYEKYEL
jgi:hypothetical protein